MATKQHENNFGFAGAAGRASSHGVTLLICVGAQERTRTSTPLRELAPEGSAPTDFRLRNQ